MTLEDNLVSNKDLQLLYDTNISLRLLDELLDKSMIKPDNYHKQHEIYLNRAAISIGHDYITHKELESILQTTHTQTQRVKTVLSENDSQPTNKSFVLSSSDREEMLSKGIGDLFTPYPQPLSQPPSRPSTAFHGQSPPKN